VLEKSTNALDAVVTKLQASLEAATSKRDKLVSDFSDSSSVFKKYDEELKKLKGTAVKKTTALKKLQATTEQSHTTLGQAQAALQEVQDKYNHAKQASADLEKNLTDAIAETQGQPQKVIDMTQALEAVKITHSELEAKFEEMSAIYENMGGDLDALGGGADPALQAKLTELETENTTQTGTIAQLKTTLEQVWTRNKELEA
jgi:chromosome segregation ATPase